MKKHDSHNKPRLEHQFIISLVKFLTCLDLDFLRCKVSIMLSYRVLVELENYWHIVFKIGF